MRPLISEELKERHARPSRAVALAGAALAAVSPFLSWAYTAGALDGVSLYGNPSPLQWVFFVMALLLVLLMAPLPGRLKGIRRLVDRPAGARALATGLLVTAIVMVAAIAIELGGLVTLEPGAWVAFAGALLAFLGTRFHQPRGSTSLVTRRTPSWVQVLAIVVVMAGGLFLAAYALGIDDGGSFVMIVVAAGALALAAGRLGVGAWLARAGRENRTVLLLAIFVTAFLFPFTQNGTEANMSIATQALVFAVTALGLNIVVGLAGLLDLGYIAFLGAGAFTAAVLSESAFSTISWHPPFIVTVLISGLVASCFGLLIGSPTLRVSGDYLAIVTLAFGEIFRITMNNLDGTDGPMITRGANGISAIPDLNLLGFDFGKPHQLFGITFGRFSSYYFLLLILLAVVMVVFANLNNSRIGRGWIAIREDEKAAEAMGVNVFGLKLFAFAGGAFLAGVAGAVKAHQDVSIVPDQFVFLESAFLLAAVVLGGMGTIGGVILGAVLLKLMPEKLRFINEYRLLIFGVLLVLMMRFRPEGLIPAKRRQLEFHEDDEELADDIDEFLMRRSTEEGR